MCPALCMTQVEVQCGERGRVLAYIWNAYLTTHEDVMQNLRAENNELGASNNKVRRRSM